MTNSLTPAKESVCVEIAGVTIAFCTENRWFRREVESRYAGFLSSSTNSLVTFDIEINESPQSTPANDSLEVRIEKGEWVMERSDFRARWNPETRHGHIVQAQNFYATDCVLRIVHTLISARQGGFLVHAASALRGGKAFLFAGVSGAGKTTISRLAPPDVELLTDEISYVRREREQYLACGTPFAGELGVGENESAPLSALFLLEKGSENRIEPLHGAEAIQGLLRNILFFAEDPALVKVVFHSACEFASSVPIRRLVFVPDARVWDILG